MRKISISIFVLLILIILQSFRSFVPQQEKIQWHSFSEAVELNKKNPKKIFIDVYTHWCYWCKVMDANTFTDPLIVQYMNKYYYAVKLDAEMKDTVVFENTTFINPSPGTDRSVHQLAYSLLNGQMSYPTSVYLDEHFAILTPVPGYMKPENLEPLLVYYGENHQKTTKWEEFSKTFIGKVKAQ